MISVLVPVYNRDVNRLAAVLSNQLSYHRIPGELIFMDDGSLKPFREANAAIQSLPFIKYIVNEANQGRMVIRKRLCATAAFNWLLFLDGDSAILSGDFLLRYVQALPVVPGVVSGGRTYAPEPPACEYRLHWTYGRQRETIAVKARNKRPYHNFMSNNFLIHKELFNRLPLIEDWKGYGHEDTLMGMQLEALLAPVKHIDNPTGHEGVENTADFLEKSEQALQNLARLEQFTSREQLKKHVRLFRGCYRLRALGLTRMPPFLYGFLQGYIRKKLFGCRPSLFWFDFYRLVLYIKHTAGLPQHRDQRPA